MAERAWNLGRSICRHLAVGLAAAALLIFGVGGWAATTELGGAIVASGTLVVASSVKKVQHPTGGVVGELLTREGEAVRAGDVLVRLDGTVTRANLGIIERSLVELYARLARLDAERDDATGLTPPTQVVHLPDAAEVLQVETKLLELRRAARAGQKEQLQARIGQLREQIRGSTEQISAKAREVQLITTELEGVRDLWRKSLIPVQRVTALEREAARLQGERGQLIAVIAQTKAAISETELQIIQIDQDLRSEVAAEMREVQARIAELNEKRAAAKDLLDRVDIRAPQDGAVHQLSVHTVGGVIGPGETIMLIVPRSDLLLVEAKVGTRDVDQIALGQSAILRFTAFNQRTTPEIAGTLTLVSGDQVTDEKTGASYFKVQIAPAASALEGGIQNKLVPGMPVEAFIQTGSRTALSYLLKPLSDQLARTFRED